MGMFFSIQHYYEFSDGNQFCYHVLPRNDRDVLPIQDTSGYHRNHNMGSDPINYKIYRVRDIMGQNLLNISKKGFFKCPNLHMPHQ